jgi:stearoyl-CoA desaturase (Delta-9 desaturase)
MTTAPLVAPRSSALPAEGAEASRGPAADPPGPVGWTERLVTAFIVVAPLVGVIAAVDRFWHHGIGWFDVSLAVAFYVVTGFGVSLGFHRLFSHRSFRACRWLRISLAVAGSMASEGSVISWVSHHRRHHVYADRPGDPHSPHNSGTGSFHQARGLVHAHVGWLFSGARSNPARWSKDLLADSDVAAVNRLTPLWMVLTFVLPFAIGWAVTRSLTGALLALVWAGAVRVALLHHVTWSVNSLGHMFGKHPNDVSDHSGNIAWLALPSFGDSWHNSHHAFPVLARHGVDRHQLDPSAGLLRVFERLGWASHVRWPRADLLVRRSAA